MGVCVTTLVRVFIAIQRAIDVRSLARASIKLTPVPDWRLAIRPGATARARTTRTSTAALDAVFTASASSAAQVVASR